jgi:hypothetical protein
MVGARARELYDKQAKERIREATVRGNKSRVGKPCPGKENFPELANGQARDKVGEAFGVSGKTIDMATKVLKKGIEREWACWRPSYFHSRRPPRRIGRATSAVGLAGLPRRQAQVG